MEDERSAVEVVRDAFDGIHKFFLGILLLGVAVASIVAGGTAGWALGACLLLFVGFVGVRGYRRLVRPEESDD